MRVRFLLLPPAGVIAIHATRGKEKLQAARAENATTTAAAAASKGNTGVQGPRGGGAAAAGDEAEEGGVRSEMLEINDFLFRTGLDNMNLFKLQRYMRRSEISRKVCSSLQKRRKGREGKKM